MTRPEQQPGPMVALPERVLGREAAMQHLHHWRAELRLALLREKQHLGHSPASSSQPICQGYERSPQFRERRQRLRHQQMPCLVVFGMS